MPQLLDSSRRTTATPGPRPIAFPPALFAVAFLAGIALQWIRPLPWLPPRLGVWLGAALVALCLWLAFWARRTFDRAGTTVHPYHAATALVTAGPFGFSRNPMYLAMVVGYVGAAMMIDTLWPLLLLPPLLVAMHVGVIAREERHLEAQFGEDYRRYRVRVRRWL